MDIVKVNLSELKPDPNNARKHSSQNILAIKQSLQENPQYRPFVVQKGTNKICVGNGMYTAMQELGIKEGWVEYRDLDEKQFARLSVTDNRTAELAEWDEDILQQIISNYGDDITIPGFGDDVSFNLDDDKEITEDEVPEITEEPVTKLGDVWILGKHRVLCGDSTKKEDVDTLTAGVKVDLVVTDPPYNVDYVGKTKDELKIQNDKMGNGDFYQFLLDAFTNLFAAAIEGAPIYVFHADSEGLNFRRAMIDSGYKLAQCCIWVKQSLVIGRQDYQWQHEPVLYGWKEGAAHKWHSDRKQTTVWNFNRPSKSVEHPTMKPVDLVAYPIKNSSVSNCIVLDLFGGSGSTLIACEQLNRTCYMMELDERYVSVIINRYLNFTGRKDEIFCIRDGQKLTYDEVFKGCELRR